MNRNAIRPLNVLVGHAEPLLAIGLAAALRQQPDLAVFLQGADGAAPAAAIDVVVTDYQAGLPLAADARRRRLPPALAGARVLVVTPKDREHEIRQALDSGVHGYLLPGCCLDELVDGVRALGDGSRYMSRAAAQCIAESLTREALTAREIDVLRLLARGWSNKTIARELEIAIGTVKAHVKGIMGKLDAATRTEAASIGSRLGLVDEQAFRAPAAAHAGLAMSA